MVRELTPSFSFQKIKEFKNHFSERLGVEKGVSIILSPFKYFEFFLGKRFSEFLL